MEKPFVDHLNAVLNGESLSRQEAAVAMAKLFAEDVPPEQKAAFLAALQVRGETAEELAGFLTYVRAQIRPVPGCSDSLDCVGTGGDGAGTFNISTASAILAAACGVPMAKHGNRGVSSRSGSANVIDALGIRKPDSPEAASAHLRKHGFVFLFAPHFSQAFAKVAPLRQAMGVRTCFNLFGPMVNPASPKRQVIGVYAASKQSPVAETLKLTGSQEVMVIHSADHLDEFSIATPTHVLHLKDGAIRDYSVSPEDAGLARAPLAEVQGGDPEVNAEIIRAVLRGTERGAKRDIVLLNTAAVLVVAGKAADFRAGAALAAAAIDDGRAATLLENLRAG
jgi:anthranilate phosphoribosyltransferase